ncbi:CEHC1 [Auxenochlorella protothecoides x Auxenochlorella symbiontica]
MNTDVHPSLYADALLIVVEYLDAKVLAKISCVQRAWRYALSSPTAQHLWLRALGRDWGDETAAGPPDRKCRGQPPHCLYREWVMFAGGCCPVAQAVVRAWKDIETWLSKNCPQIIRTLRPGATERQLRAAEATLGFPLPPGLRMILRVHDGQFLRPRGRWQSLDAFCGVFGGYSLYDDYVTMGLLSLGEILALSSSWNSQGGRDSSSLIFACSQGSVKQICIDKVNGAVASILGQAVAFPAAPEGAEGCAVQRWFCEYARRLRDGVYAASPIFPLKRSPSTPCLYPVRSSGPHGPAQVAVTQGIRVHASVLFLPEYCSHPRDEARGTQAYTFAYQITFSLLSEEEQAAAWDGSLGTFQPLLAVQLVNRTWRFLPTGHDPILASGPGVVGLFPQLSAGGPSLTYTSCTQMPCPTGRMTGSFGFKEGDAEAQGTRFIEAACPTVHLTIPEYIY